MGLHWILKKLKQKEKEMRVLILGLDNAGKTTIVKKFKGEDINTISPTLGFSIQTLEHMGFGFCEVSLRVYNNTARYIDQGCNKRPGAFAIYLEPWHPDVFDFVELRKNTGAEESRARDLFYALWIPDLFMRRVRDGKKWTLMDPHECPGLYETWGDDFDALYENYEREGRGRRTLDAQTVCYKLNIWDVGGQRSLRSYWRNYFEQTDALIWVVDSGDRTRMVDCCRELANLLQEERLSGASLLVFANKQDLSNAMDANELRELLGLDQVKSHHWAILSCSAVTGHNLLQGINWLVKDVSSRIFDQN